MVFQWRNLGCLGNIEILPGIHTHLPLRIQVGRFSPLFSIRFVDVLKTSAAESDEGSGLLLEELGAFLKGTERSSSALTWTCLHWKNCLRWSSVALRLMPAQNASANGPASVSLHVDYQSTVHPPLEEKDFQILQQMLRRPPQVQRCHQPLSHRFGHVSSMYRSSPRRSTLNTNVITSLDMCQVCTDGERSIRHTKTYCMTHIMIMYNTTQKKQTPNLRSGSVMRQRESLSFA